MGPTSRPWPRPLSCRPVSIMHRLLTALTVPLLGGPLLGGLLLLGACARSVGAGPSSPVGPTVETVEDRAEPGGIEGAVVVDEGYGLNVATQEFEHSYGQYLLFTDGSILDHCHRRRRAISTSPPPERPSRGAGVRGTSTVSS